MSDNLELINEYKDQVRILKQEVAELQDAGKSKDAANKRCLQKLEYAIFTRMTGTGSCCFTAFTSKSHALEAHKIFKSKFSKLWSVVCENNFIKHN